MESFIPTTSSPHLNPLPQNTPPRYQTRQPVHRRHEKYQTGRLRPLSGAQRRKCLRTHQRRHALLHVAGGVRRTTLGFEVGHLVGGVSDLRIGEFEAAVPGRYAVEFRVEDQGG